MEYFIIRAYLVENEKIISLDANCVTTFKASYRVLFICFFFCLFF
jgi:hypothetical protein